MPGRWRSSTPCSPKNCESRRIEMALRILKLPSIKTLARDSTSRSSPRLSAIAFLALARLDVVESHELIPFFGPSGTGKSHLATALGGRSVYFASIGAGARSPAEPLRRARRKRNAFVFSTNRSAESMPIVGKDSSLHPEPVRRTDFVFANGSD